MSEIEMSAWKRLSASDVESLHARFRVQAPGQAYDVHRGVNLVNLERKLSGLCIATNTTRPRVSGFIDIAVQAELLRIDLCHPRQPRAQLLVDRPTQKEQEQEQQLST
jgi:hypothetical protein